MPESCCSRNSPIATISAGRTVGDSSDGPPVPRLSSTSRASMSASSSSTARSFSGTSASRAATRRASSRRPFCISQRGVSVKSAMPTPSATAGTMPAANIHRHESVGSSGVSMMTMSSMK